MENQENPKKGETGEPKKGSPKKTDKPKPIAKGTTSGIVIKPK